MLHRYSVAKQILPIHFVNSVITISVILKVLDKYCYAFYWELSVNAKWMCSIGFLRGKSREILGNYDLIMGDFQNPFRHTPKFTLSKNINKWNTSSQFQDICPNYIVVQDPNPLARICIVPPLGHFPKILRILYPHWISEIQKSALNHPCKKCLKYPFRIHHPYMP